MKPDWLFLGIRGYTNNDGRQDGPLDQPPGDRRVVSLPASNKKRREIVKEVHLEQR